MRPASTGCCSTGPRSSPQPGKANFDEPNDRLHARRAAVRAVGRPARPARGARRAAEARRLAGARGVAGTPDVGRRAPPSGCERDETAARSRAAARRPARRLRALRRRRARARRRGRARLRYWSPWNEPNHPYSLSPQRDAVRARAPVARRRALRRAGERDAAGARRRAGRPGDGARRARRPAESRPYTTGDPRVHRRRCRRSSSARRRSGRSTATSAASTRSTTSRRALVEVLLPADARDLDDRDRRRRGGHWAASARVRAKQRGTCEQLHRRLVQWYQDKRVTAAFQYTLREDDVFPVGLVTTDLTGLPVARRVEGVGSGQAAEARRPGAAGVLRAAGRPALSELRPAWASSHSASDVKPTITPSIQYCERTASRGSLYIASARSCASTARNVAGDDERDLEIPGAGLAEDRVVDRVGGGPEQVPALAEGVRCEVADRLALVEQEREVVRGDVDAPRSGPASG